jgi:hypothetical protein
MSDIYYVAYGSNLLWDRFGVYLHGGSMRLGDIVVGRPDEPLMRLPEPPSRWVHAPGRLYYDARSRRWRGPVAFVDLSVPDDRWIGRAWRIPADAFPEIVRQENGHRWTPAFDMAGLRPGDWAMATDPDGRELPKYGCVARLPDVDGIPAFTITARPGHRHGTAGPVNPWMYAVMALGLRECPLLDIDPVEYLTAPARYGPDAPDRSHPGVAADARGVAHLEALRASAVLAASPYLRRAVTRALRAYRRSVVAGGTGVDLQRIGACLRGTSQALGESIAIGYEDDAIHGRGIPSTPGDGVVVHRDDEWVVTADGAPPPADLAHVDPAGGGGAGAGLGWRLRCLRDDVVIHGATPSAILDGLVDGYVDLADPARQRARAKLTGIPGLDELETLQALGRTDAHVLDATGPRRRGQGEAPSGGPPRTSSREKYG